MSMQQQKKVLKDGETYEVLEEEKEEGIEDTSTSSIDISSIEVDDASASASASASADAGEDIPSTTRQDVR